MPERSVTSKILHRLRMLVFLSDSTQRDIEHRAGFSRGYLSQLLKGTVEIKYWQLLAILEAMELKPADFFSVLFPRHCHPALEELFHRSRRGSLSRELARLYAYGIESIVDLYERLERCESALDELVELGVLNYP